MPEPLTFGFHPQSRMPASFYILASRRNGTLYHRSTNDLSKRVWEHKSKLTPDSRPDTA
jgi:putative endonuclease